MTSTLARRLATTLAVIGLFASLPVAAWELSGTRRIVLHDRDGGQTAIGKVTFTPGSKPGDRIAFVVDVDHDRFKDFFLSMKEFKCLEVPTEVYCHVPYPYQQPATVTADDLTWLEHQLLFMFKAPRDFGARLWNGVYYQLQLTDQGLVGKPQAVDLNQISAPPADTTIPPYGAAERSDIAPDVRWFNKLTIQ